MTKLIVIMAIIMPLPTIMMTIMSAILPILINRLTYNDYNEHLSQPSFLPDHQGEFSDYSGDYTDYLGDYNN